MDRIYQGVFQNISCYCLTDSELAKNKTDIAFQNISCYCLTKIMKEELSNIKIFQNISCYCLTFTFLPIRTTENNFKTSHVIV